jgi:tRNA A-37 threonylcarbamoyl transferase component Bud32
MAELLVCGRYRLRQPLGSGGMGSVWRAYDELLGRKVAVKRIDLPEEVSDEERTLLCERASREARAAARIDHPGIVTVHDVVVADALPWIVMELIEGRSLAVTVREDGPCEPRRVAEIGLELLAALAATHREGLIHRDVKPGNVLLASDGRVLLTDFGIASLDGDPALTRTGVLVGSPGYIAPERLRDQPAGPASDLWSLGATLYAAVEGRGPFDRESAMAALGAVLTEQEPYPERSGELGPVLAHLLAKDPAARIGAAVAREALRRVATGESSGLPGAPRRRRWRALRRPVPIAAAGTALLAVAGAVVLWPGEGERPPSPRLLTSPPEPCALATAQQAASLVRGARGRPFTWTSRPEDRGCRWSAWKVPAMLEIQLPKVYGSAAAASRDMTANLTREAQEQPSSVTVDWDFSFPGLPRKAKASEQPPRVLSGVGDQAFVSTMRGADGAFDRQTLAVRQGNVVVYLVYQAGRGVVTDGVRRAGTFVAGNLARLEGRR